MTMKLPDNTMTYVRRYGLPGLMAGALLCHWIGGLFAVLGVPLLLGGALACIFLGDRFCRRGPSAPAEETTLDVVLPHLAKQQVDTSIADVELAVLGTAFRKKQRKLTESTVDGIIDTCIALIQQRIEAHTIAIFFPTADNGYFLRAHWSMSDRIKPDAVIRPGQGILGSLLKDGLKTLSLQEITNDSTTLYYYAADAGVRSLIACPIIAGDAERGIIVVDSTRKADFQNEQVSFVTTIASMLGQGAFNAYLTTERNIELERLATVSGIEKDFFRHETIDDILDNMVEIIHFAFECDRMTLSMRVDDKKQTASIRRVYGVHTRGMLDHTFSLSEKTLASVLYSKNICFSRNFANDRYEIRYFEKEPRDEHFASFLAVPFGVEECTGMILLESFKRDAFSNALQELLWGIATSAGLAIAKIALLEKTNAMATHDGLTGLYNHRQFQLMLKEEIVRAGRYSDSMSLIICDIDFFKRINDSYGHPFGDAVLREVARILQTSIRETIDIAARYGGEEFALVLVKADEAQAVETAERIRQSIEQTPFKNPSGGDVRVTMSFGIAVLGKHAKELGDLIKKADKALYRAKGSGRNRVEVF